MALGFDVPTHLLAKGMLTAPDQINFKEQKAGMSLTRRGGGRGGDLLHEPLSLVCLLDTCFQAESKSFQLKEVSSRMA
ncbi:hypothetical protein COCOBI_05-0900 [Coccomyxa sp. Obi]|nr:hypothetical protein COCOBI_05-0900 [Coccomyxa sp. Obi]